MIKSIIYIESLALKRKGLLMIFPALLAFHFAGGQNTAPLSLDSCLAKAERNYPQIRQYELLDLSGEYSLTNAQKGKLPQLTIAGQAHYQSDVTSVPGAQVAPGIEELSKDQYKLYGEIVQPLTGLAIVDQQKKILAAKNELDRADLEVQLYPIKERVSDLFFGILLLDGQLVQTELTKTNLEAGISRVEASITYGTALKSSKDVLMAELYTLEQRKIEQQSTRASFIKMLGLFLGETLDEELSLTAPEVPDLNPDINRPELKYFEKSMEVQALQSDLLDRNNLPQFSLFFQGGFGRPALDFLRNDFEPYYLGGLRLSWKLSGYYTSSNEKQIHTLNQQIIGVRKETFLFNTDLALNEQRIEIGKIRKLIDQDEKIIDLRDRIVSTSKDQLENGVITSTDYKAEVIEADKARQNKVLHEVQLLKVRYRYKLTSGN